MPFPHSGSPRPVTKRELEAVRDKLRGLSAIFAAKVLGELRKAVPTERLEGMGIEPSSSSVLAQSRDLTRK
jgi:hypothetical protein